MNTDCFLLKGFKFILYDCMSHDTYTKNKKANRVLPTTSLIMTMKKYRYLYNKNDDWWHYYSRYQYSSIIYRFSGERGGMWFSLRVRLYLYVSIVHRSEWTWGPYSIWNNVIMINIKNKWWFIYQRRTLTHLSVLKVLTFGGPKALQKGNTAHFLVNFTITTF